MAPHDDRLPTAYCLLRSLGFSRSDRSAAVSLYTQHQDGCSNSSHSSGSGRTENRRQRPRLNPSLTSSFAKEFGEAWVRFAKCVSSVAVRVDHRVFDSCSDGRWLRSSYFSTLTLTARGFVCHAFDSRPHGQWVRWRSPKSLSHHPILSAFLRSLSRLFPNH